MASLFVAVGDLFSRVLMLAIGIPVWLMLAAFVWFICSMVFGPAWGFVVAAIVILHYHREG